MRPYCGHYGQLLNCGQTGARDSSTARETGVREHLLYPCRAERMKHRSPSEQHHGKRPRVPAAAASNSPQDGMEEKTPTNPRELTQNPLKKIWMPCKNGLPEKHISQRKGAYDNVAANVSIFMYSYFSPLFDVYQQIFLIFYTRGLLFTFASTQPNPLWLTE